MTYLEMLTNTVLGLATVAVALVFLALILTVIISLVIAMEYNEAYPLIYTGGGAVALIFYTPFVIWYFNNFQVWFV